MAKAIFVMDMPEQVCQKCTLCYETENDDEYMCCATGKFVPNGKKPDWCPLRELPEKKEEFELLECEGSMEKVWEFPSLKNKGFNACLDEILKEKKVGDSE